MIIANHFLLVGRRYVLQIVVVFTTRLEEARSGPETLLPVYVKTANIKEGAKRLEKSGRNNNIVTVNKRITLP
jgi:hypothetical protein